MTLKKARQGIYLDENIPDLKRCDGIIFDCDGVLVDISGSYDLAIRETARHVLGSLAGISDSIPIGPGIIDGFKATGGFNDEVDLAYASILSIVAAERLGRDQKSFVSEVIANSDHTGIKSAERYIEGLADVGDIIEKLDYPGPHAENLLYQIFDQMFYGERLYKELFGRDSQFPGPGLIENDVLIVNDSLLDSLEERFQSKMAVVTGRGMVPARHSLGPLLDRFDLKNSAFLEDEPRSLAKPSPEPLLRSIRGMGCDLCIYVGDSMEDHIMAKRATELGCRTVFCGIAGTSRRPGEKLALFEGSGAQVVLDSIRLLPEIL